MFRLIRFPARLVRLLLASTALALGQIWANKVRSMLTTIGIVIGVAAVTAVIAALSGLQAKVLKEFETFGTNNIFIGPSRPETGPKRNAPWQTIRFYPDHFDGMLEHCPSIARFTRLARYSQTIRHREKTLENVTIVGIEPDWHVIESRSITLGRPISVIDTDHTRQVCLITPDMRDKLRLDRDCVGQSIYIGPRLFQIVGLVEKRVESSMFGGFSEPMEVYIPFQTAWQLEQPWMFVVASSASTDVSEEARAEARFFLRRQRQLRPGEPDTFRIEAVEQFVRQFNQLAVMMTLIAGGVVSITLLVGGVGIMNIMLVSVSERTREIGLRKAVGARPSAILLQFLVEAVALCFVGGAMGLAVGQALTYAISNIPNAQLEEAFIPMWAIATAFGFAAVVGLVFGMFPAWKASRLDPIEALRHE